MGGGGGLDIAQGWSCTGRKLISPLEVTAEAAESQITIAKKTVQGETMQLTAPHVWEPQAISPYVPTATTMKMAVKSIARATAGHTRPFRTPSVSWTASDTPWTYETSAREKQNT